MIVNHLDKDTPEISKELLLFLHNRFNALPPQENETLEQLKFRAGEQNVISFLKYINEQQFNEPCVLAPQQSNNKQPLLQSLLHRLLQILRLRQ